MNLIGCGVLVLNVIAVGTYCVTLPIKKVAKFITDTYAGSAEQVEAGHNSPEEGLIKDRLAKRMWIKDNISMLLTHVTYHRNNNEDLHLPQEELWKVGDEEGSRKLL